MSSLFLTVSAVFAATAVLGMVLALRHESLTQARERRLLEESNAPGPWSFRRPEGVVHVGRRTGETHHLKYMRVRLLAKARLPALELRPGGSLRRGSDFDQHFAVLERGPGAPLLLRDAELQRRMMALARRKDTWDGAVSLLIEGSATGCQLELHMEGWVNREARAEELADEICGLARAAAAAWDGPWRSIAEHWELGPIQHYGGGLRRIDGKVDGIGLEIEERVEGAELVIDLHASIPGLEELAGAKVTHRDDAAREGWGATCKPTGNPVLDMCVAVRGAQRPAVRALLEDAALTEALLAVVHGRRGILDGRGVHLRVEDPHAEELAVVVSEILDLARALQRRL